MAKVIKIIAAITEGAVFARNNGLPWPWSFVDMGHFAGATAGTTLVMGSGTWNSLPAGKRPLKGRENVVVSSSLAQLDGAIVVSSFEEAIRVASCQTVTCIGGAGIWQAALPHASTVYLTIVKARREGGWVDLGRLQNAGDKISTANFFLERHLKASGFAFSRATQKTEEVEGDLELVLRFEVWQRA